MHDRNMLWKAHDFLAYARQPRTAQTSVHHPDAGTGPCPLASKHDFLSSASAAFLTQVNNLRRHSKIAIQKVAGKQT